MAGDAGGRSIGEILEAYRELSRYPLYESSSSDDDSVATDVQRVRIERRRRERYAAGNAVCLQLLTDDDRVRDDEIAAALREAHSRGRLSVRAHEIAQRRSAVARCTAAREVFPGWFVHHASIRSWDDAHALMRFVKEQYGGTWEARSREFVADHPLKHDESCSAKLQNMRCKDFMLVSMYYMMRDNDCSADDLTKCDSAITPQFREALLESVRR